MGARRGSLLLAFVAVLVVIPAAAAEKPSVVSLDYCADQYVLALADPGQIIALSPAARSEYSYHADRAEGLPSIRPTPEDVLLSHPDLVVRQWGGGFGAGQMLERAGVPVVQVASGETQAVTIQNLRQIGAALDQEDRAEALVAQMQNRLSKLPAPSGRKPRALYVTAGGATTGAGTFIHHLITTAGLDNAGALGGHTGWRMVDMEQLALDPPDIIIAGFFDLRERRVGHWSAARHSLLKKMMVEKPVVIIPSRMIACSAWFFVDAVDLIRAALPPERTVSTAGAGP